MKKRRRINLIGVAFAALIVLVLMFLARVALHRPPEVTLPQLGAGESVGDAASAASQGAIRRVEVTPETVQRVIERLARAENYRRTITLERFWADGSGLSTVETAVAGRWMRLDETGGDVTRHVIVYSDDRNRDEPDGRSWVWYGDEQSVFSGAAALSADEEQSIPTYEDILLLDTHTIAVADYRALEGVNCIYVETAPDASGYAARYWVSVDNGLLAAAERLQGETMVYTMRALTAEIGTVDAEAFTLPDGEILYDPNTEESEG